MLRRYWTQDIHSLNSHFGTEDDLKALSSALHNRSMYLMVDVVVIIEGSFVHTPILDGPRQDPLSSHVKTKLCTGELGETPEDVAELLPVRDVVQAPTHRHLELRGDKSQLRYTRLV